LSACDQAFAPQDASIEVRVDGFPADPIARVTVYVRDTLPPYNMSSHAVAPGGSVTFDNLGAGFGIEVGIRDLAMHRCSLLGANHNGLAFSGPSRVVETTSGVTESVVFTVRCLTGRVDLQVSGLLSGDSGLVSFASPVDTLRDHRVRNGTTTVYIVPSATVTVRPDLVAGSDGFIYDAPPQTISVSSGQATSLTLQYGTQVQNQAALRASVSGIPSDDPAIQFPAFAERVAMPGARDSGFVGFGMPLQFDNLARGEPYDVSITGLSAFQCFLRMTGFGETVSGDTVTVRISTASSLPAPVPSAVFPIHCRTGALDLIVSGLPAGDAANVQLDAIFDSATVRVTNGTTRINLVPYLTGIDPRSVTGSDGLVYDAPFQTIQTQSRQTVSAMVHYTSGGCPADRPVAWYRLDGDATDASGNGNHGVLLGPSITTGSTGSGMTALDFDGIDDRIDLGDRFNGLTLPFTVAAWVFQPASARGEFRAILITDDEPGRYLGIWFQLEPPGLPQITYADGGPPGPGSRRTLAADSPIPTDQWVHIAATVRGPTDMTMYVDGVEVAGTYSGTGGPLVHAPAPARIGSITTLAANQPWLGGLDEITIYDCSLDAGEVAYLRQRR
jgi:hypothetical protein